MEDQISLQSDSGKDDRNWADLPWDILSKIFENVGAVYVLSSAQSVCQQWWRLAHDHRIWRQVHIRDLDSYYFFHDLNSSAGFCNSVYVTDKCIRDIALTSIDRSAGCLEEFYFSRGFMDTYAYTNLFLKSIAERSSQLKVLHLKCCYYITEQEIIEACKSFPLLQDLNSSNTVITEVAIEAIGHSCPNLKAFSFRNIHVSQSQPNTMALAIAKHMRGLQKLEMIEDRLHDDGLLAILDGCSELQCLYVNRCCSLMFGEKLKCRLDKIEVKYYNYKIEDYVCYDDHGYKMYSIDCDNDHVQY